VDGEGRGVDGLVALNDVAGVVDEDQMRDADLREVARQRIQPEVVGADGVADGDVAGDALVEAAVGEAANGRFQQRVQFSARERG
jgi:hypothetical protein